MASESPRKIRVTLECSERAMSFIAAVKELTGATSTAEVVRRSLEAYYWLLSYAQVGYRLRFIRNDDEIVEAFLPAVVAPASVE